MFSFQLSNQQVSYLYVATSKRWPETPFQIIYDKEFLSNTVNAAGVGAARGTKPGRVEEPSTREEPEGDEVVITNWEPTPNQQFFPLWDAVCFDETGAIKVDDVDQQSIYKPGLPEDRGVDDSMLSRVEFQKLDPDVRKNLVTAVRGKVDDGLVPDGHWSGGDL